jgi:hypothetical protein
MGRIPPRLPGGDGTPSCIVPDTIPWIRQNKTRLSKFKRFDPGQRRPAHGRETSPPGHSYHRAGSFRSRECPTQDTKAGRGSRAGEEVTSSAVTMAGSTLGTPYSATARRRAGRARSPARPGRTRDASGPAPSLQRSVTLSHCRHRRRTWAGNDPKGNPTAGRPVADRPGGRCHPRHAPGACSQPCYLLHWEIQVFAIGAFVGYDPP